MTLMRWARGCPPAWQITRALSEESDPVQDHITTCRSCTAEYRRLREVVVRAGLLAVSEPMNTDTRQAISARLLAGPAPVTASPGLVEFSRRVLRRPLGIGMVAVGALGLAVAVWGIAGWARRAVVATPVPETGTAASAGVHDDKATPSGRSLATVHAVGAARFTRVAPPPDERVQLQEGVIALDVVALRTGERFRVVTDDAEVEVRGTHFEVSAARGRLAAVRVSSGRVQVRSAQGALAVLDAGDEWVGGSPASTDRPPAESPRPPGGSSPGDAPSRRRVPVAPSPSDVTAPEPAPAIGAVTAPTPLAERAPPSSPSPPSSAVVTRSGPATATFDRAWALLRAGDARGAASAFAAVERAAGTDPLTEDAAYWRAVAVARSGDTGEARELFTGFVARFPASARRGEASVALGWLLLEAGHGAEARAAFERASADPAAPVRASARQGLSRIPPPHAR